VVLGIWGKATIYIGLSHSRQSFGLLRWDCWHPNISCAVACRFPDLRAVDAFKNTAPACYQKYNILKVTHSHDCEILVCGLLRDGEIWGEPATAVRSSRLTTSPSFLKRLLAQLGTRRNGQARMIYVLHDGL
jgi:hypothetical protein